MKARVRLDGHRKDGGPDSPAVTQCCIPANVISFHYVSPVESRLLYQYLSRTQPLHDASRLPRDGRDLQLAWPVKDADVGPYSRRVKTGIEAQRLYDTLFNHIVVLGDRHICSRYVMS